MQPEINEAKFVIDYTIISTTSTSYSYGLVDCCNNINIYCIYFKHSDKAEKSKA